MVRTGVGVLMSLAFATVVMTPLRAFGDEEGADLSVRVTRPLIFDVPASGGRWCLPTQTDPGGRVEVVGAPRHAVYLVVHGQTVVGIDDENWGQTIEMESMYGPGDFLIPASGVLGVNIGGCVRLSGAQNPGRYRFAGNFSAFYE